MANVQIPQELFVLLYKYFLLPNEQTEANASRIRDALDAKLEAMARRELYTTYKTADSDAEREQARTKYLRRVGIPEDYTW